VVTYNLGGGNLQVNLGPTGTNTVNTPALTANTTVTITQAQLGGCSQALNNTATIVVSPANTAGAPSANPTLCVNAPLSPITIATTGATGIANNGVSGANGLPAGVSASWASNTITITGTPTATGTFPYSILLTGGCGTVNATGTITVNPLNTAGTPSSTPNVCVNSPLTSTCNPSGNVVIYANYEGGILNINVDQNIPNLEIGVISYEDVQVNIVGPFAANVAQVLYVGLQGNNDNCNLGVSSTVINAPVGTSTQVLLAPPSVLADPDGNNSMICAYSCGEGNQGGCNTAEQVVAYFLNQFGGSLYAYNTQYACWPSSALNVSAASSCCPGSQPLTITTTGATGIGTPTGLPPGVTASWSNNVITISGTPTAAGVFNYSIPLTGGCGTMNATGTITVNAATPVTLTYGGPFCPSFNSVTPTNSWTGGGTYSSTPAGLNINPGTGLVALNSSTPGTYTVTFTPVGCALPVNTTVQIQQTITPLFNAIPIICYGAAAPTLSGTSTNGIQGSWNPTTISNTTSGTYVFTPNANQCASPANISVSVSPQVVVDGIYHD
jgi:hypothetical protein